DYCQQQQQQQQLLQPLATVHLDRSWRSFDSLPTSPLSDSASSGHTQISLTPCHSSELLVSKGLSGAVELPQEYSSRNSYASSDRTPLSTDHICTGTSDFKNKNVLTKRPSGVRLALSFIGLFFTIFLSGLDQTVTSTILTRIADDFRSLDRIEWVPTIFMLCSTCLNIISGRVADIFGRFSVLMFSLVAFVAGAVLSASSQSIVVFIVARGISGIACGGMLNLSIIIISDIVPIERRGKYLGFLQICFGASNAAGPLIGGLFADRFNWRAAFFADMIMGVVTIVFLAAVLKLPKPASMTGWKVGVRNLDYAGVITIITSISLLIVGLNMGGTIQSWSSPATIGCIISGCVLLGVFVAVELRLPRLPLVPMWIFTVPNLVVSFAVTFLCGMTMFSIIFFMPVYFSAVYGANAMRAGLLVLPFGISLSISSFGSGYFMSKMTMYRLFLRAGPAIMAIGVLLLALLSGKTTQMAQAALLIIPGIGMGNIIVANVIAAQASTAPQLIATITPLCEFFLSIGGVIGVAIFGAVYRNRLAGILTAKSLGASVAAQEIINEARRNVSVVYTANVSDPVRAMVADAYVASMRQALW
ncbi:hypothetical protein GGI05_003434, partial [Coemansia sp. RSA 2603]